MEQNRDTLQKVRIAFKEFGFENSMIALVMVFLFIGLMYSAWPSNYKLPEGVLVNMEPMQLETYLPGMEKDGVKIRPLAFYTIKGRVLDKNRSFSMIMNGDYNLGGANVLLGWKNMSDTAFLDKMSYRIKGKTAQVKPRSGDMPENEYLNNVSFNYLIPSNEQVEDQISNIREGEVVKITGYLVELRNPNSPDPWRSSLSRFDKGDWSGEIIWVQEVQQVKFEPAK